MAYDDLTQRLRAARPAAAEPDPGAFDAALLGRARTQPIDRHRPVAIPAAAVVAAAVTAVVTLGGGPGGGPSSAAAVTQTLHWLNPPAGTALHTLSVEKRDGRTRIHEFWDSADSVYDPATNTIRQDQPLPHGVPSGDAMVAKVRILLQRGDMRVTGPVQHAGRSAWAISLRPDEDRAVWTLWVSAADGRPLELRDPADDQTIRWRTYEVVPAGSHVRTLREVHPSARVVPAETQVKKARGK